MSNPIISVIVPVYNAERYLRHCIDSVLAQTFAEFELLLIDDGSVDKSGQICDEYCAIDERARVFHNSNCGANISRSFALKQAKGYYVYFVDSDDSVGVEELQYLIDNIDDYDLIIGECHVASTFDKKEYLNKLLNHQLPFEMWGKLFKRELFMHEWCMAISRDVVVGEDFLVNVRIALNLNSVKTVRDSYYLYNTDNVQSVVHKFIGSFEYEEKFDNLLCQSLNYLNLENEVTEILARQRLISLESMILRHTKIDYNSSYLSTIYMGKDFLKDKIKKIKWLILSVRPLFLSLFLLRFYLLIRACFCNEK